MQPLDTPIVKDLVLIGGGHSHVSVLKMLAMDPMPGVRITLIARDVHTPYSGMLPGLIAGHYTFDETHIDLGPLCQFAGARLIRASANGLNLNQREVLFADRPPLPFDILSINTGSTPRAEEVPGAEKFAVKVKPINTFLKRWEELLERITESQTKKHLAIVGAGAGGIELAFAIHHRVKEEKDSSGDPKVSIQIFSKSPTVLPHHNKLTQKKVARHLSEKGIECQLSRGISEVGKDFVIDDQGTQHLADEVLWVTQATAAPWIKESDLETDSQGFIKVKSTLESISHPGVFACGDVAHVIEHPREKAGVFAVRQGPPLFANLVHALKSESLEPFTPQKKFLTIISTGEKYAIASRNQFAVEGKWVWKWKDWIDQKFMEKFNVLPEMEEHSASSLAPADGITNEETLKLLSKTAMRCGGCGAKVGSSVLSKVLSKLKMSDRQEGVHLSFDQGDDAAVFDLTPGLSCVQTIDFFRSPIDDPYLFGKIAANHALSDIFAMGAKGKAALAVATVPFGLEEKVEATLYAMLQGAVEVLDEAGVALVGGHSGEGKELALGFSITGEADSSELLKKRGLELDDVLVLTKPIGTGTLLAGDMRLKAKGRWISHAIDTMLQSNLKASEILKKHGSQAATDITGFGLLGHALEMLQNPAIGIKLSLKDIPYLEGATELVQQGIFSTLQESNVRLRRGVEASEKNRQDPRFALLFDPQTSGGLLAGLHSENVLACLEELNSAGYHRSQVIGRVVTPNSSDAPIEIVD